MNMSIIITNFEDAKELTHYQNKAMTDNVGIQGSTIFRLPLIDFISIPRNSMSYMS